MRISLVVIVSLLFSSSLVLTQRKREWVPLLDDQLSKWGMYLSYRHKGGYKGESIKDSNGNIKSPLGYDHNENNVFSTINDNGQCILRISGEIYGCVFTREKYRNYHLKLKVKWGEKKWSPRLNEPMDSGILYHSQGDCGVDYWRSWMLSQEFQIIESSMGDYWSIASSQIDIKASRGDTNYYQFDDKAKRLPFGLGTGNPNFCMSRAHSERPKGDWNELELICFEGKSIHIVNGQVVMALANSRYSEGNKIFPLLEGRIQLQSEAAEVFFKDIYIRSIEQMPDSYSPYFN